MKNFVLNSCQRCDGKWRLPQESKKAMDEILACKYKRCPFAKDEYEWYWKLMENLGPEAPAYPEDVHEGLPTPIQGLNHVDAYKVKV